MVCCYEIWAAAFFNDKLYLPLCLLSFISVGCRFDFSLEPIFVLPINGMHLLCRHSHWTKNRDKRLLSAHYSHVQEAKTLEKTFFFSHVARSLITHFMVNAQRFACLVKWYIIWELSLFFHWRKFSNIFLILVYVNIQISFLYEITHVQNDVFMNILNCINHIFQGIQPLKLN